VGPVERVVYTRGTLEVGAFRCPAGRPDFRDAGSIRDHCVFVFPRTSVWIRHEGDAAFLADPTLVTFYNPGQRYTREAHDPRGDLCEWFAVDAATACDVAAERRPAAADRRHRPFAYTHGPSDAATYLAQRRLFRHLRHGAPLDALGVEETVLGLLRRVLALAAGARGGGNASAAPTTAREREAVEHVRRLLADGFRGDASLGALARAAGLSPFRLCRAFSRVTGRGLHAYRDELRLREGLAALEQGVSDLTGLALDLGYSSHSHFAERFRRRYGVPPSRVRAWLGPGRTNGRGASGRPPGLTV
jgi:AraC-like DNA-binding protein